MAAVKAAHPYTPSLDNLVSARRGFATASTSSLFILSSQETHNPRRAAADQPGGTATSEEGGVFTWETIGHDPQYQQSCKALEEKSENVFQPSGPITVVAVRVIAFCSDISEEVHFRLHHRYGIQTK